MERSMATARRLFILASLVGFASLPLQGMAPGVTPTCFGRTATLVGTAGGQITGTNGSDVIVGLGGRDDIDGRGGNDYICAGGGADGINGGPGADHIKGGAGTDLIMGARRGDRIRGGPNNDALYGGNGGDVVSGDGGRDYIRGGGGFDALAGGAANDALYGDGEGATEDGGSGTYDRCIGGKSRNCEILASTTLCPPHFAVKVGVYEPARLDVRDLCRKVTGVVASGSVGVAHDGDLYFNIDTSGPRLHVEFMPRDRGHLEKPAAGERITLWGAYVYDTNPKHYEIHPVFQERYQGTTFRSGPQHGGSPPDLSPGSSPRRFCWTARGARCRAWDGSLM
jgi:RTX calcium-binding nonapeptide repeat (4 copies)